MSVLCNAWRVSSGWRVEIADREVSRAHGVFQFADIRTTDGLRGSTYVPVQSSDLQGTCAEDPRAASRRGVGSKPRCGAARVRGGDHTAGDRPALLRTPGAHALL